MRKSLIIGLAIVLVLCCAAAAISLNQVSNNVLPAEKISAPSSSGKTLISGGWGKATNDFGKDPNIGDGPASFSVSSDGEIYILDQINKRVKEYDPSGKLQRIINIDRQTVEDLAVLKNGNICLLDPVLTRSVFMCDQNGMLLRQIKLNQNIKYATSVRAQGNDLFVEDEHTKMYKVISDSVSIAEGNQAARMIQGRPARGQSDTFLKAARVDKNNFNVDIVNSNGGQKSKIKNQSKLDVLQLLLLDSDASGNVYTGMEVVRGEDSQITATKYDAAGKYLGKIDMPDRYSAAFKVLDLDNEGNIYQMQTTDSGYMLVKWQFTN